MNFTYRKKLITISVFFLHSLGLFVAFFHKKNQFPFHLPFHLLRFFTWWSVHSSFLAIFALAALFWEEKKQKSSWLSQFILLSAALFNLVTLLFCLAHLFCGVLEWENSFFLKFNSLTWHFIAPPLVLYCFYVWGRIDFLKKKIVKSLLFSFLWPLVYFVYVYFLSWLHTKSKVGLYLKKYPYQLFQFLARKPALLFLIWLPVSLVVISALFWLLIGTKTMIEKRNFFSDIRER